MAEIQEVRKRSFRDKTTGILVWWGFVAGDSTEWDERLEDIDFALETKKWRWDESASPPAWVPVVEES